MTASIGAVEIHEMPPMQITVTVLRRVRLRLWLFRQIMWLLSVVYPGQCTISIKSAEGDKQ